MIESLPRALGAIALGLVLAGPVVAQQPAPAQPFGGPPAAAAPAVTPSPAALQAARTLITASGIGRSFDVLVPNLMEQIYTSMTQTRPELQADMKDVLQNLLPEFQKQTDQMVDAGAAILATQMTEQELAAADAFFTSPAGKKYVDTQPAMFDRLMAATNIWAQKVGADIVSRVRVDMKKRGKDI